MIETTWSLRQITGGETSLCRSAAELLSQFMFRVGWGAFCKKGYLLVIQMQHKVQEEDKETFPHPVRKDVALSGL